MERHFVFYSLINMILFYFLTFSKASPWTKRKCWQIPNGYDCSDMDLQVIPDEIPNTIQILRFCFNNLPSLYNTTFQKLKSLRSLDLTRCGISFMYEDVFKYQTELEVLILIGNPLDFIAARAFSGPLELKQLSLAQSNVKTISDIPSDNLMFLEVLDLGGSDIRSLDGLNDFHWQKLNILHLDMISIDHINVTDLQPIRNVAGVSLNFKGNDFIHIEAGSFRSLNLSSLDFTGCFAKIAFSSALKGLEGVTTNKLNLGLYETHPNVFISSADLESFCKIQVTDLSFQLQHFLDLNNSTFHCLKGVRKLDLCRSHLDSLPFNMSGLSTLSHLILDENSFLDVCQINTRSFPKLTHLSVSRNLKELGFGSRCLESLGLLEELDLSLSSVNIKGPCCNDHLVGLGELKLLNLSYASPMVWSLQPFSAIPQLKHLDLSYSIYALNHSSPFSNLQDLQTLNLSWSKTNLKNVHLFKGLKTLRHLDVKGNAIVGGVLSQVEHFMHVPLLESLILSSCEITAFDENLFKGLTHLRQVDLSENKLVKLSTSGFYSLVPLQLNFASNAIVTVDVSSVMDLGRGSSVDLSYNPLVCNCSNFKFFTWVKRNTISVKHLMVTVCNGTRTRITDAKLQCEEHPALIFFIILAVIIIAGVIFFFVRKARRQTRYTQL